MRRTTRTRKGDCKAEKGGEQKPVISWSQNQQCSLFAKLDKLTDAVIRMSSLPSGTRICAPDSYMALGFCLPKSPSPYVDHAYCPSGFTLSRGVCYRWPSPQCQTQNLANADSICKALKGRLCAVPELDRLAGTGCNFDSAGSWALLGLQYSTTYSQVYGYCLRDDNTHTAALNDSMTQSSTDDVLTIAWCNAVTSLAPEAQSNIKAGVICCKT